MFRKQRTYRTNAEVSVIGQDTQGFTGMHEVVDGMRK
jgi:hypothetical protein